jgi:hypothetical protein
MLRRVGDNDSGCRSWCGHGAGRCDERIGAAKRCAAGRTRVVPTVRGGEAKEIGRENEGNKVFEEHVVKAVGDDNR